MTESLMLRRQLRQSIDDEIAQRTADHQARMARLAVGRAGLAATAPGSPLVMLAHGDSWFDYPLDGNGPTFGTTDVIHQLGSMGAVNPIILNISHHGDASTDEMSLPKQQRLIQALQDPKNWGPSHKPDAILISCGGNDMAGDQFCIFLDQAGPGSDGLDAARFSGVLGMVKASFLDLFDFRDRHATDVPIFAHCYDFPIPNGVHPICAGPWLQPSLTFAGWTDVSQGTDIVRRALLGFKAMLAGLAADAQNQFTLVDTQGTLAASDWANELHPFPTGFQDIAGKFVTALRAAFPNRI
ncbi:MAG TPA: hypothetical protein VMG55_16245 [Stellaceae bacterium]|nr:hypothetical protein [Stellaceae bacterium]